MAFAIALASVVAAVAVPYALYRIQHARDVRRALRTMAGIQQWLATEYSHL